MAGSTETDCVGINDIVLSGSLGICLEYYENRGLIHPLNESERITKIWYERCHSILCWCKQKNPKLEQLGLFDSHEEVIEWISVNAWLSTNEFQTRQMLDQALS